MTELEQQRASILGTLAESPELLTKVLSLEKDFKVQIEDFLEDKGDKEGRIVVTLAFMTLAAEL